MARKGICCHHGVHIYYSRKPAVKLQNWALRGACLRRWRSWNRKKLTIIIASTFLCSSFCVLTEKVGFLSGLSWLVWSSAGSPIFEDCCPTPSLNKWWVTSYRGLSIDRIAGRHPDYCFVDKLQSPICRALLDHFFALLCIFSRKRFG